MQYRVYYLFDEPGELLLYIGRSCDPLARQRAFERRYGIATSLSLCQRFTRFEDACAAELRAIAAHRPPYNKNLVSSRGMYGRPRSAAYREALSRSMMGKPGTRNGRTNSAAHRAAISAGSKNGDPEYRRRMSETQKGRVVTEATRAKLRAANLGKKQTPETRAKKSAATKGRPLTAEHRAAISAARRKNAIARAADR